MGQHLQSQTTRVAWCWGQTPGSMSGFNRYPCRVTQLRSLVAVVVGIGFTGMGHALVLVFKTTRKDHVGQVGFSAGLV